MTDSNLSGSVLTPSISIQSISRFSNYISPSLTFYPYSLCLSSLSLSIYAIFIYHSSLYLSMLSSSINALFIYLCSLCLSILYISFRPLFIFLSSLYLSILSLNINSLYLCNFNGTFLLLHTFIYDYLCHSLFYKSLLSLSASFPISNV